jgi:coenzyme F420-reducing hydrogenase gamma subunit
MKPRLGVFKFASCDGCQLQILNAEDELLALAEVIDLAYFPEASSRQSPGPYDIALVEGSITTAADAERILRVRADSRVLVTIGACATAGGIQALRNWADVEEYKRAVYPHPEWIDALPTSTPIAAHVRVDHELLGCPIDLQQLLLVLRAPFLTLRARLPTHSVCLDCKRRGLTCVVVAHGTPCLGPGHAYRLRRPSAPACSARCGCFGPSDDPNLPAFTALLGNQGLSRDEAVRRLRSINGYAPAFHKAAGAQRRGGVVSATHHQGQRAGLRSRAKVRCTSPWKAAASPTCAWRS